jgi:hypothetical protein
LDDFNGGSGLDEGRSNRLSILENTHNALRIVAGEVGADEQCRDPRRLLGWDLQRLEYACA